MKKPGEPYTLGPELAAVIDDVDTDVGYHRYVLHYTENGETQRIQTVKYDSSCRKCSRGDTVTFRVVKYESGAEYAMICDSEMKELGGGGGHVWILFAVAGAAAILLSIGLFLYSLF